MTTAKTPAAKKVAAPRKRAARKATAAREGTSAVAPEATSITFVSEGLSDPTNVAGWTFTRPEGADTFVSDGTGPALSKLTPRALENLTFMATDNVTPESEGNTPQARKYWTRVLARHGVTV